MLKNLLRFSSKSTIIYSRLRNVSKSYLKVSTRKFSNNSQNPQSALIKRGIIFSLPLGIGLFYISRTFINMEIISNSELAKMLEQGDIQHILTIDEFNKFVAQTHSKRQDGSNYVRLDSISSHEELLNFLAIKESELKIPENDRIQLIKFPNMIMLMLGYGLIMTQRKIKKIVTDPKEAIKYNLVKRQPRPKIFGETRVPETESTPEPQKSESHAPPPPPERNNPLLEMFGGSNPIKPSKSNLTFNDVVGLHSSKQEVIEFVEFLKNPEKFHSIGAKLPKGALLLGPPGCGKTLLVKALSNEAGVPFYEMAGSEFVEIIGGLGAKRIRDLFKAARKDSPSIIFIDEIDSIGRIRSTSRNTETEQTLNQLLVEMDGIETMENVIIFAATNRADLLDKALLRAGRFDRHIYVDLPNLAERKDLFNLYVNKYKLASDVQTGQLIDRLAGLSAGMSGADISQLCNEAALITARRNNHEEGVTTADFENAFEKVTLGPEKKTNSLTIKERHVSAIQVAGKTLVSWFLSPLSGNRPVKASLLPRAYSDGLGGFSQVIPQDKYLLSYDELCARISVMLGGRAAEQLELKSVSDASHRQLKQATELAFRIIQEWGMSSKVGHVSFQISKEEKNMGILPYSKKTQNLIEEEAKFVISQAFQRSMNIIENEKDKFDSLVKLLLEKEVLNDADLSKIFQDTSNPT